MESIERQIRTWMDRRPYRFVNQRNPEFTRYSTVLKVIRPPDLKRWSVLAGDCFHNLRSALDHLVFAVALHEIGPADFPTKTLSFVIADDPDRFKSGFYHIAPLSAAVRAEIEALQPYKRPHAVLPPVLAVLREFDDVDKHRLIQMAITQVIKGEFNNFKNFVLPPGHGAKVLWETGELKDGTEVATILLDSPAPDMNYNFDGEMVVSLGHAVGPSGRSRSGIGYLFAEILNEVQTAIERVRSKVIVC